MHFGIVTLFPEMFSALNFGVTGRAISNALVKVTYWNPRDFTTNKHRNVDDRPYGGGPGMVMMVEPLQAAIQAAKNAANHPPKVIYLSPQGKRFDQEAAERMLLHKEVILVSGRYEGVDERLLDLEVDEEWSLGDFVLSGGEFAAMTMIDTVTRLIPGALGHEDSAAEDSLTTGLLEYPQYTRPESLQGLEVPAVLLSGDHKAIQRWRLKQSLGRTWMKKPELLAKREFTEEEQHLLNEFINETQREK